MADSAALLVDEVLPRRPIRQWVLSLPFALRFLLATKPAVLTQVLGIVIRAISGHLIGQAGHTRATAETGAVTLIQRFGSALNFNIHFHMLFLDGVYATGGRIPEFKYLPPPSPAELQQLVQTIAERIGRSLERQGLIVRDMESSYLALDPNDGAPMDDLLGHSITYRIATGPRQGQKVLTLQTVPPDADSNEASRLALSSGFSLHAGVAARGSEREKLERLCRYISRPAVSTERLALTQHGHIRYTLKKAYRDGTTHVVFEPMDFIARLAALVPRPRMHLTRFHGVFAPHSRLRSAITLAGRGSGRSKTQGAQKNAAEKHVAMTWMQRLKRVFRIDIERCARCGGTLKVIASIEDPDVIHRILDHLGHRAEPLDQDHAPRAPPQFGLPL